jgi:SAM-dependent methyltransferase
MPDVATLSSYYPADYHSFESASFITKLKHQKRLKSIMPLIADDAFTLLDYGCGGGSFLEFVAEKYPKATLIGFEIAGQKQVVERGNGRIKIIHGGLEDLLAAMPSVDIISMHHVIEHLPDPFDTVSRLGEKIRPGGHFIGQTPACDSFEFRLFQANWSGFHAPRHTVVFSTSGMKALLQRARLSSVKIKGGFNPGGIAVSLASLPHGGKKGRIRRQGIVWLFCVGLATILYPLDWLSGKPGIMDFEARK